MKVSFVVPVYNVESYLRQCVDSILSQTYRNIEVILVDDGSPDRCPAMCDAYTQLDCRVKVLHKPNGGLSDARNTGLMVATGDYVIFVDSDDMWMRNDSLENLIAYIKRYPECQFYGFNCQSYYSDTQNYRKWLPYSDNLLTPISGSMALHLLVASGTVPMSAWMKVIDRNWLLSMKIIFKVGQISEDVPWFIDLLDKCDKCVFVNDYIYAYRQNVIGSISSTRGERSFYSVLDIIQTELELIDQRTFTTVAKDSLRSFLAYELSILMSMACRLPKKQQPIARKELKKLCWLFEYTQNPKVRMVSRVYNIFGYAITERVLRLYDWYRRRK